MDITRRTDYAIRIMLELAAADGGPISVRTLAENGDVPYAFARSIARDLVAAGLVESRRGVAGGLVLARDAEKVSLLDVVEATQGRVSCSVCTNDPGWCKRMGGCNVHAVWAGADVLMREYLGSKSLGGLVKREGGR